MHILIAGATGFIGTELIKSFPADYKLTVVGRDERHIKDQFAERVLPRTWKTLPDLDATPYDLVINLAGHNIAASRWTESVKKKIIDSRVNTNAALIKWLINQECKPHFYSANAIGIYGMQENGDSQAFDENSPIDFEHPRDFLSEVGVRWQQSVQPAIDYGMSVTLTRFGVVLMHGQGMLKKLTPSFKLGLGSVIGDGKQVISWIHIADLVRALNFLFDHRELTGPFNLTSPNPVSQAEFAKTLAHAMHRPLFLKTPAFVMRMLFGEMGECLINRGQRVVPKRLPEEGFKFTYSDLAMALKHEYDK